LTVACFLATFTIVSRLLFSCVSGFCATPSLALGLSSSDYQSYCLLTPIPSPPKEKTVPMIANALITVGQTLHGFFFEDGSEDNATECLSHLLMFAPRRDLSLLFTEPASTLLYFLNNIRWALWVRPNFPTVPWPIFLDHVLPSSVVDEPRDISYSWRSRYFQLFYNPVFSAMNGSTSPLEAAKVLSTLIPTAQPEGKIRSRCCCCCCCCCCLGVT
jgi:hypothetical protein